MAEAAGVRATASDPSATRRARRAGRTPGGAARRVGDRWVAAWRVVARLPAEQAEEAGGWLSSLPGALGAELVEAADGARGQEAETASGQRVGGDGSPGLVEVRVYFESLKAARRARTQLRRALQAMAGVSSGRLFPTDPPSPSAQVGGLSAPAAVSQSEARRWLAAWRRTLATVRVGGFLVRPVERLTARRPVGRRVLRIRPGMAFGTGHHPTTRQALWAVEQAGATGRVVDVGTGSGILAVAAAKAGAREVLAVDLDPRAVEEARRHVVANGVADRVRVMLGSVEQALQRWGAGSAQLVVANLTAPVLARLAESLAALVAPGGRLVGAGISDEGLDEVLEAWQARGLEVELYGQWGAWAWVEAVRR